PGGTLTSPTQESIVRIDTRATSAEEVANYPISSGPAGGSRVVYVRDVAHVVDSYWERRSGYHFLDHAPGRAGRVIPSIAVSVIQDPAASSYYVVPAVEKVLAQLEQEYPGIHFRPAYDNSRFVNILFRNVWHELGLAILLTAIVV